MGSPQLVLLDYRADRIYGISAGSVRPLGTGYAAEHAGILPVTLGSGIPAFAFADDLRGELRALELRALELRALELRAQDPPAEPAATPGAAAPLTLPIAIPAEHLACDPDGRFIAVTTGLGVGAEPWRDIVTVIDLHARSARRFRTRTGEPGVGIVKDHVTNRPVLVLRHREPGAIEAIPLDVALAVGPHVPVLRGALTEQVAADGHGDVAHFATGVFATATGRGLECFTVSAGIPEPTRIIPWPVPGRAFYLRLDPESGRALGVVRGGPPAPSAWTRWDNHLVELDLATGQSFQLPLPPGLTFRFAHSATRAAAVTIHPDGDELTIAERLPSGLRPVRRLPLPPLSAPPTPGRLPWDPVGNAPAQRRAIAVHPTADLIAVTRGGDGQIHLISETGLETLEVPTPIDEGGLLYWSGGALDTVGR